MQSPWMPTFKDLKFSPIKDIVRQRVEMYGLKLASSIFVYPDYPHGWHAVFGVFVPEKNDYEVNVIFCVWGRLTWETNHPLLGILPSGAPIVHYKKETPEDYA